MRDYSFYYKSSIDSSGSWGSDRWDLLLSAYNSSERVRTVFDICPATRKEWLIHPEYAFSTSEYPPGRVFAPQPSDESEFLLDFVAHVSDLDLRKQKLCVDITGFMRPHLMFLVYYLKSIGVTRFDILYSEPGRYSDRESTIFSDGAVREVRQVAGFEGSHVLDTSSDVLVLGSGYDVELMRTIAEDKRHSRKIQFLGLPSLRPEMYQENILQAARVREALGKGPGNYPGNYFSPASDPFITATLLSEVVQLERNERGVSNLYLCPTGTKTQALGFCLFYLAECSSSSTSIVFPIRSGYARETSRGISRIWRYTIDFS